LERLDAINSESRPPPGTNRSNAAKQSATTVEAGKEVKICASGAAGGEGAEKEKSGSETCL
jgi:hypothetical protein